MSAGTAVSGIPASRRHVTDLVTHLAHRRLSSQHRFTLLGWMWPLLRQLAQLAVLVFLFGRVVDLGIEDYAVFVFTGLLLWTVFASGLAAGTSSLVNDRHLVFTPRFPDIALPLVAVAVPLVDALLALPVLLVLLAFEGRLEWTALLFPLVLVVQYALTAGLSLLTAAGNVFVRDVGNAVGVVLTMLFYMTPVFYGLKTVPGNLQWVIQLNPMAAVINCGRALLFDGRLPDGADVAIALGSAGIALVLGVWAFGRVRRGFVDAL